MATENPPDGEEKRSGKGFFGAATSRLQRAGTSIGKFSKDENSSRTYRILGAVMLAAAALAALTGVGLPLVVPLLGAGAGLLYAGHKSKQSRLQREAEGQSSSANPQGPAGPLDKQHTEGQSTRTEQSVSSLSAVAIAQIVEAVQHAQTSERGRSDPAAPLRERAFQELGSVSSKRPAIQNPLRRPESMAGESTWEYYGPREPTPMPSNSNIASNIKILSPQPQRPSQTQRFIGEASSSASAPAPSNPSTPNGTRRQSRK